LAVIFSTSTPKLVFAFVISAYVYALVYARLVHFSWTLPKLRLAKRGRPSLI